MFEWDAKKNIANIARHGVGFETAVRIFEGSVLTVIDDRFDYREVARTALAWSMASSASW
ncbi:MAG: BrnT family toxin [Allorhizobium sp.]